MSSALIITAGSVTFYPENLTLHNLKHCLSPKTALIQQFRPFQLILKAEAPQKRDQQLKRNTKRKKKKTDLGYSITKLERKADLKKTSE